MDRPDAALPAVHPYLELREPLDERAARARVIEMDVRSSSAGGSASTASRGLDAALGAWVDESPVQFPAADDPLATQMADVDQARLVAHARG